MARVAYFVLFSAPDGIAPARIPPRSPHGIPAAALALTAVLGVIKGHRVTVGDAVQYSSSQSMMRRRQLLTMSQTAPLVDTSGAEIGRVSITEKTL